MRLRWLATIKAHCYPRSARSSPFPLPSPFTPIRPRLPMAPHHTPYVTPHILHKNYAQAHDSEQFGSRMSFLVVVCPPLLIFCLVIGQDPTTSPKQVSTWTASPSSAMLQSPCSTRTPFVTRAPSSPPRVPSLTFPEKRPVAPPRTSVSSTKTLPRTTSGGVQSTSRWTNVCLFSFSTITLSPSIRHFRNQPGTCHRLPQHP